MKFFFILFFLLPLNIQAQIPEPKPNTYVNDYTGKLNSQEIEQLNIKIRQLETETNVQLAVLLIKKLPPKLSIEEFSRKVGNQWKIGNNFDGLVYVASLNDRKHRLEVAKNLEGTITDATAFEIIESIKHHLQEQKYFIALTALVNKIIEKLGAEKQKEFPVENSKVNESITERKQFEKQKAKYDYYGEIAIGGIVLGAIAFCIWAAFYKKKYWEMHTVNGVYRGIGSMYYPVESGSSDYGSSGFGGGGGGGGGFSGGGASGSW